MGGMGMGGMGMMGMQVRPSPTFLSLFLHYFLLLHCALSLAFSLSHFLFTFSCVFLSVFAHLPLHSQGMGMGMGGGGGKQSRIEKWSMKLMPLMSMMQMPMMMMTQVTSMIQMQMMGLMQGFEMGIGMMMQAGEGVTSVQNKMKGIEIDEMTGLPKEKVVEVYEPPKLAVWGRTLELEASKLCIQFQLLRYVFALLGVYPRSPKALKKLGKEERKRARRETKQLKLITKGNAKQQAEWEVRFSYEND